MEPYDKTNVQCTYLFCVKGFIMQIMLPYAVIVLLHSHIQHWQHVHCSEANICSLKTDMFIGMAVPLRIWAALGCLENHDFHMCCIFPLVLSIQMRRNRLETGMRQDLSKGIKQALQKAFNDSNVHVQVGGWFCLCLSQKPLCSYESSNVWGW